MYGDFLAKNSVCAPYIPINVWFWLTLPKQQERRRGGGGLSTLITCSDRNASRSHPAGQKKTLCMRGVIGKVLHSARGGGGEKGASRPSWLIATHIFISTNSAQPRRVKKNQYLGLPQSPCRAKSNILAGWHKKRGCSYLTCDIQGWGGRRLQMLGKAPVFLYLTCVIQGWGGRRWQNAR
jgi:hypothetical protein